jgi:hypothetical protein
MSMWQNLFLGPYAAFSITRGHADALPEDENGELLGCRSFYCHGLESKRRAYYMPRGADGEPPKPAPREMYFGGQPGWPWRPDLVGIKPRAEVNWFVRAYKTELAEVVAAFGSKPVLGWGLLSWYS